MGRWGQRRYCVAFLGVGGDRETLSVDPVPSFVYQHNGQRTAIAFLSRFNGTVPFYMTKPRPNGRGGRKRASHLPTTIYPFSRESENVKITDFYCLFF